jgi:hypothetical protein
MAALCWELRPAIDGGEFLAIEDEADRHHGAFGTGAGIAVTRDVGDFGIREQADVKIDGLFGITVEPQMGNDGVFDGHGRLLRFLAQMVFARASSWSAHWPQPG